MNAWESGSNRIDTGEDEVLRPVGVVYISWAMEDIEYLACLSDRTEQRVVTSLSFLLAIEPHRGALGSAASTDDRTVKVKGQTAQAKYSECLQNHLSDELSQGGHAVGVSGRQQATHGSHIRKASHAEDT